MQLQSIPYSMLKTLLKFQNIFFLIFLSGKLGRKTKLYSFPPVDDLQKVHSFFFFCTLQKVHSDVESPDCTDFFCFLRIPRLHGSHSSCSMVSQSRAKNAVGRISQLVLGLQERLPSIWVGLMHRNKT